MEVTLTAENHWSYQHLHTNTCLQLEITLQLQMYKMTWMFVAVCSLALVSMASASCNNPSWVTYSDSQVVDSVADDAGNASVADCKALCLTELNCLGIDYTDDGQCLLTTDPTTAITDSSTTTHYWAQRICTEGDVTCTFKAYGQFEVTSGEVDTTTGANTLSDCEDLCTISQCTAFAWEPFGTFGCIKTSEPASSRTAASVYTMLVKTDCTGVCSSYSWVETSNKVSASHTRTSAGDESAFACQLQCLGTSGCVSVDYISSTTTCYIQTNPDAALSTQSGTNHYQAQRDCTDDDLTCTFTCLGSYVPTNDLTTDSSSTFDDCAESCVDDDDCTAFAYAGSGVCQTTTNSGPLKSADSAYSMYQKGSCVESGAVSALTGSKMSGLLSLMLVLLATLQAQS